MDYDWKNRLNLVGLVITKTMFGNQPKACDLGLISGFYYKEGQWGPKTQVNGFW